MTKSKNDDLLTQISSGEIASGTIIQSLKIIGAGTRDYTISALKDDEGNGIIHAVSKSDALDAVKILKYLVSEESHLSNAAIIAKNNLNQNALHIATSFNNDDEFIDILCHNNVDANAQDDNGDTPLHIAARAGFLDLFTIETLYKKTEKDDVENNARETFLDIIDTRTSGSTREFFHKLVTDKHPPLKGKDITETTLKWQKK